jgi:hypothetical protein
MMTHKIKTHNPWAIFIIIFCSFSLSIGLLKDKFGDGFSMLFGVIVVLVSLVMCYFLLSDTIEVTITDKGINSSWMKFPFFNKTYKEILWTDMEYWNFVRSKMMDAFIIKTKNKESFSIRCLNINLTQIEFSDFLKNVTEQIEIFNQKQSDNSNKIKAVPSIFKTTSGIILAIIFIIFLVSLTYFLINKPGKNDSSFLVRTVFLYLFVLIFIGFVVTSQLVKRRRNKRK